MSSRSTIEPTPRCSVSNGGSSNYRVTCVTRTSDDLSLVEGFIPFLNILTLMMGYVETSVLDIHRRCTRSGTSRDASGRRCGSGFQGGQWPVRTIPNRISADHRPSNGGRLLLLVGLWTPLAGLLIVALESWLLLSRPLDPWPFILLATLGAALALLGPGAWSADARLYGWKRVHIRDHQTRVVTSAENHE